MQPSEKRIQFVTISLKQDFFGDKDLRTMLDATMFQLVNSVIIGESSIIKDYLKDLYDLCIKPAVLREVIYQVGESMPSQQKQNAAVFDTHIKLLMKEPENGDPNKEYEPTTKDIIGFVSYALKKADEEIQLSQCVLSPAHRDNNACTKALLGSIVDEYNIGYKVISMRSSPDKMSHFLACGFTFGASRADNLANTELYKHYAETGPEGSSLNLEDGSVNLFICLTVHCSHCHSKGKMSFCSVCHNMPYCSPTCQRDGWHAHKDHCRPNAVKK